MVKKNMMYVHLPVHTSINSSSGVIFLHIFPMKMAILVYFQRHPRIGTPFRPLVIHAIPLEEKYSKTFLAPRLGHVKSMMEKDGTILDWSFE